jgi:hypothetical protein
MSFENRPKAPATQSERDKMAIAFIECSDYIDDELGRNMASLIRKGLVVFTSPNLVEISEEGERVVEEGISDEVV